MNIPPVPPYQHHQVPTALKLGSAMTVSAAGKRVAQHMGMQLLSRQMG